MDSYQLGQYGEQLAVEFLKNNDYDIKYRNYYAKRWGEIDIVAINNDQTIVIEVKTRRSPSVDVLSSIHQHKLAALVRTIYGLIQKDSSLPQSIRIDVICIVFHDSSKPQIRHYQNVYQPV